MATALDLTSAEAAEAQTAGRAEAVAFIARKVCGRDAGDLMDILHAVRGTFVDAIAADLAGNAKDAMHYRAMSDELLHYATGVARYLTPEAVKAATDAAKTAGRI